MMNSENSICFTTRIKIILRETVFGLHSCARPMKPSLTVMAHQPVLLFPFCWQRAVPLVESGTLSV